jgi:hypothetical protein
MSDRATLVQIYVAFYNRAPDPVGLDFWQKACDAGLPLSEIAELFVPQAESITTYPFLGNPAEAGIRTFIANIYQNLFNRAPDAAGETFWTNEILKSLATEGGVDADGNAIEPSGLSIGEVVLKIIEGAQGDDITTLANKTTIALDWHDQAALVPDYVQTDEATTASRLALGVVDEGDFSLVQGRVLNENYFEDLVDTGSDLTPFVPGAFVPVVPAGTTPQFEIPANGFINNGQNTSEVVVLADGKIVVSYVTSPGPGAREIAFRIMNADGTIAGTDKVIHDTGSGSFDYAMTALPDGNFIIFANGNRPDLDDGLHAFRFDGLGRPVDDPVLVTEINGPVRFSDLSVTYLPTGNLFYTYSAETQNNDGQEVFGRILTPEGEEVTEEELVNERSQDDQIESASAALADGTTLVVYTAFGNPEGDETDIMGRLYNADGTPAGDEFIITEITRGFQAEPAVATLGGEKFVVVFQTDSQEFDNSGTGVSAIIFDRNGEVEVDEFPVNDATNRFQKSAKVAELADGNFVVLWQTDEAFQTDIRAKIFEPDGSPVGGEIDVNVLTAGRQDDVDVAVTQNGFVVSWTSTEPTPDDPSIDSIRLAAFDLDGAPVALPQQANPNLPAVMAAEFQVNDEIEGSQHFASVVGLTDGRSVVSYRDAPSGNTFFEVRGADGSLAVPEQAIPGSNIEMFATPDGGFVMVGNGNSQDGLGQGIVMEIFDSDLNGSGPIRVNQTAAPTGASFNPVVAVKGDGTIYVSWTFDPDASESQIMIRPFASDGTALRGEVALPGIFVPNDIDVTGISVLSDGAIMMVGETRESTPGSLGDVYVVRSAPDFLTSISGALAGTTVGEHSGVTVAPLEDGHSLIIFGGFPTPGDTSAWGITGVIVDETLAAVGAPFRINETTNSFQTLPDAAPMADGRILVTWSGITVAGGNVSQDTYGRFYNADGSVDSSEFILNSGRNTFTGGSDVAAAGEGFVVAWQGNQSTFGDNSGTSVSAAIFDKDANPIDVPLVFGNQGSTSISTDNILDLQDIPLPGTDFEVIDFDVLSSNAGLILSADGETVRYNPFPDAQIRNLPVGDQVTEIFAYTVEDDLGNEVELVGTFIVQGYEDIII